MHKYTLRLIAAALILGSTGLLVASAAQDKAGKKDRRKLQGTWTAKQGELTAVMTIKGRKFTFTMEHDDKKATAYGTYTIDTSKDPKTIDMKIAKGKGEDIQKYVGKTSLGIFKVKGKTLTWCASQPGEENRPSAFDAKDGKHLLLSFQRKKKE